MREKIQGILEHEPDKELAALKVCALIDGKLALMDFQGKGLFDDDAEFQDWLNDRERSE